MNALSSPTSAVFSRQRLKIFFPSAFFFSPSWYRWRSSKSFSFQKQRLKAKLRRSNDCKVTTLWFSLNITRMKNRNLMVAYSDMRIVEASLEAIPQIYFLIVFSLASWLLPKTSYLGLINILPITFSEAAFILLSIAHSFASSITSIIREAILKKKQNFM